MVLTKCVIHLSQCGLVSDLGFGVIYPKTWHNTQCHIAFWTYNYCPTMLLVCGPHNTCAQSLCLASAYCV